MRTRRTLLKQGNISRPSQNNFGHTITKSIPLQFNPENTRSAALIQSASRLPTPVHVNTFGCLRAAFHSITLVTARAAAASTADAFDLLVLLQLFSGHAADACAVEVRFLGLNA